MIMETKKFHKVRSASWRTRKASGAVQCESRGSGTSGAVSITPGQKSLKVKEQEQPCRSARREGHICSSRD